MSNKPPQRRAEREIVSRLPPHSEEAEQGVLGCLLLDPHLLGETSLRLKRSREEAFYDLRHRVIYATMADMYEKHIMIDTITLMQQLKDSQQLEAVGGVVYISSLPDAVPSAANLEYYLNIVLEKYKLRKVIQAATDLVGRAYDQEGKIDEFIGEAEAEVMKLGAERFDNNAHNAIDLVRSAMEKIERVITNQGRTGLSTGFPKLDKCLGGLEPEDYILIAARPSMGKTSFVMNIVDHLAVTQRIPVGVFSVEMAADMLMLRMLCARAQVDWRMRAEGLGSEEDAKKLTKAAGQLSRAPIHIDDTGGLSTNEFRTKARRMVQLYGVKAFVVDYLQIMTSSKPRTKRHEEISDISGSVKACAKELKVPVIALSQVDRGLDREPNRPPRLSDLRESGSLEQDADKIGFLYEPKQEAADPRFDGFAKRIGLLIAKQRNGATDEIAFDFFKRYTLYQEHREQFEPEPEVPLFDNTLRKDLA